MYSILISIIYTCTYLTITGICSVIPQASNIMEPSGLHNTSDVDFEQLARLLQQNSDNSEISSDGSDRNVHQCPTCHIREHQKRLRINSIKSRLSHALRLDVLGLPNVTGTRIPKIPSYERLRRQYDNEVNLEEMQYDQPYSYTEQIEDEEDEFGRMERTFISSEEPPVSQSVEAPNAVYFNIPAMENQEVLRARLWVYIAPPRTQFNLPKNVSELFLYKLVPPWKHGGPPVKRFLKKKKKSIAETSGWHHFDITDLAHQWISDPSSNLGVVVEAFDGNNENLIVLPSVTTYNSGYVPNLDIKTITILHNQREKRSTPLNCDEQNQFDTCCRYPLTVDFVEFGWDFVIAPQRYDAYYCAGECRDEGLSESGHSAVVQQIPESRLLSTNPGPCCSPARMANLKMLYFDHQSRVQLTTLPRMKVVRCGCA
ncbi:growth/differentiation factor 8-like [Saccostrea echinata]|uniref:growth/differentiation factor 8-like n=1 Tax=Saccostrea echinata TaxID=191078 RepID=UPI002A812191|nr:growth/differentiation factor 8-like [Saccostrea echinata]